MLSIIIPTMQKDLDVLNKLLLELDTDKSVGEILVIDNSGKGFNTCLKKVKVFVQNENLFVNPAWNLGIKLSSKDIPYFGILNDDIIFPKNLFSSVDKFLSQSDSSVGLAGIDCATNTPKSDFDAYPEDTDISFVKSDKMAGFWGSAYFGKKENYFEIPNEIKVFYGDHFLFRKNQQAKLFKSDRKLCIKYDGVEHQKLSFIQRLFSITYYHEHYVLCLLGLKLKFKCIR